MSNKVPQILDRVHVPDIERWDQLSKIILTRGYTYLLQLGLGIVVASATLDSKRNRLAVGFSLLPLIYSCR
ncbi:hypothetical protein EJ08DRAFT_645944 [Tothia fuscella]|uniref:Uncharacterized protein n=1 Tax=Tothia fuscella TaxID=1048955 RepID=A0A9P4P1C2_9PEZI|nr:hypothetical protein EJ08DRAFT_645944 [Tothia fuscella]